MAQHFKRLASGSIIYGLGSMLQRFLTLLLLPFYTRALTPSDYGVIALITLLTTGLGGLFDLGTGNSMGILYFKEKSVEQRHTIIWTTVVLLLANSLVWIVILFFASPLLSTLIFETAQHASLLKIAFASLMLITLINPFYSYLRMEEKVTQYVVLTLLDTILVISLSIYLVLFHHWGVVGVFAAGLVSKTLLLVVIIGSVGSRLSFKLDPQLISPLVWIGFPSIFGLFAFLVIDYADRQLLQRIAGVDVLGVYAVGYNFGMVMLILSGAFSAAWTPFFMSFANKHEEARTVFGRVLSYYAIGFGALTVVFFAIAKPLAVIVLAPSFHDAYLVIGLVAAAYMLKGCYLIFLPGIYFGEKLHIQTGIEWTAAIVNLALNILLIPIWGMVGAAAATLLSYLCLCILASWASRPYLQVNYEWARLSLIAGALSTVSAVLFFFSRAGDLRSVVPLNLVTVVLFSFIAIFVFLQSEERQYMLSVLTRSRLGSLLAHYRSAPGRPNKDANS